MNLKKICIAFVFLLSFQSCTKDVDFNQLDEANIYTTYLSTLVYLNLKAPNFLDEFNKEIGTTDRIEAIITNDLDPYLEKVEFTVITDNTFDRTFMLQIIFYDEVETAIYTLQPTIYALPNTSEITTIIEIPQADIPFIYDTRFFEFQISLLTSSDGSELSIGDTSILDLKSSVKLFFNYHKI